MSVDAVVFQAGLFAASVVISWAIYRTCWSNGPAAAGHGSPLLRLTLGRRCWFVHAAPVALLFTVDSRALGPLNIFATALAGLLAFAAAFRFGDVDTGCYHLVDRMLVLAAACCAPFSPGWFYVSVVASCVLQYRTAGWPLGPSYSNLLGFESVRRLAAAVIACALFAGAADVVTGESSEAEHRRRTTAFAAVLLSVHAAYYVEQGLAKVALGRRPYSWPLENRVQCLVVHSYMRGWGAGWWSRATMLKFAAGVGRMRVAICGVALLLEIGAIALLADPTAAVAWLVGLTAFHAAVFAVSGLLCYHHAAVNLLAAVMIGRGELPAEAFSATTVAVAATCGVFLFAWVAGLRLALLRHLRDGGGMAGWSWYLYDPADLWMAWWDGPYLRTYAYTVVTRAGARFAFPVTSFSPYDTYVTDLPTHVMVLGLHAGYDPQARADAAVARCGVWGLLVDEAERDRLYAWMDRRPGSFEFLRTTVPASAWRVSSCEDRPAEGASLYAFFAGLNRAIDAEWLQKILRWPHFPGEDWCTDCCPLDEPPLPRYCFDEPIAQVEIHRRKLFYDGHDVTLVESSLLGTVILDDEHSGRLRGAMTGRDGVEANGGNESGEVNETVAPEGANLDAHWERVRRQYDDGDGGPFYRTVMGDGGDHIHYGLYESDADTVGAAAARATRTLAELADRHVAIGPGAQVVDLGSGNGGPAHQLALERGADVTCVNLCPLQNEANRRRLADLGLTERITIVERRFERLPEAWSGRFDVAWSQETLCHAADKGACLVEAARVLREGGLLVMSDILAGDDADEEQLKPFTDRNAVMRLESRGRYVELLREAGFEITAECDWTAHLAVNFQRMVRQIQVRYEELAAAGVRRGYLDEFAESLRRRIASHRDGVFRWGVFLARKKCRRPRSGINQP